MQEHAPIDRTARHVRIAIGAALPRPESRLRRLAIHIVAILALVVSLIYLIWRATSTLDLTSWWISVPLLLFEVHAVLGLALFTFSLWDVDRRPVPHPDDVRDLRIALLIPTYNEGVEILLPTVAAAVALEPEHETWVLDDGDRAEVARLAADLGARYLTRPVHDHAKAGNLNHALGLVDADLIAVLDADHVAGPSFLRDTIGYFADPAIAVVQTPQDFYNLGSFEHAGSAQDEDEFNEQTMFYRVIEPGKNRWDAAFWAGTGAVLRRAALDDVGGVATETITEDIHTTIRMHRRRWRTVYHNAVLARGLAAPDASVYQAQRLRWGIGAMQVLRSENPLFVPGLTVGQRIAYATTLLGWFDAWRTLGFLVIPIAVLLTGAVPIRADLPTFLWAFVTTFLLQQIALRLLSRGCYRPLLSMVFEMTRMTPNLAATITLVRRGRPTFQVTPKGRTADGRVAVPVPAILGWLLLGSAVAAAWFGLTLTGVTPIHYTEAWAAYGAAFWMAINAGLLVATVRRIRDPRFARERRASVRFPVSLPADLDGVPGTLTDISLTGARLVLPDRDPTIGGAPVAHTLSIRIEGRRLPVQAKIRSRTMRGAEGTSLGLEFVQGQHRERAALALALFGADVVPEVSPAAVPAYRESAA